MKTRLFRRAAWLLAVFLLLAAFAAGHAADPVSAPDETFTGDGFIFRILPDGTAEITGFDPTAEVPPDLAIPPSLGGRDVSAVGDGAFSQCAAIRSLTLPDTVTRIGTEAFSSCNSLESLNLSGSTSEVGPYAFAGCRMLRNVVLQDGMAQKRKPRHMMRLAT